MVKITKASAKYLAAAFLRKRLTKSRFLPDIRSCAETDNDWIFDFYYPDWRDLRTQGVPFGVRVAVNKRTGKAVHHAALQHDQAAS